MGACRNGCDAGCSGGEDGGISGDVDLGIYVVAAYEWQN